MPTDTRKSIKELYDQGMAEVFSIVGSLDATRAQRKSARQTANDLSSMLVAQTLQTIEGRTALLSGLIVELDQVIDSVEQNSALASVVGNLTTILDNAQKLFAKEKKQMV